MSIWCSGETIGYEPRGIAIEGKKAPKFYGPFHGEVRSYADGFSNHYPTTNGEFEQPGCVVLADVAPWCVPGHDQGNSDYSCTGCGDSHNHPQTGEWLRMDVLSQTHDWDAGGKPTGLVEGASVVLDQEAALRLYHELGDWLMAEKVTRR